MFVTLKGSYLTIKVAPLQGADCLTRAYRRSSLRSTSGSDRKNVCDPEGVISDDQGCTPSGADCLTRAYRRSSLRSTSGSDRKNVCDPEGVISDDQGCTPSGCGLPNSRLPEVFASLDLRLLAFNPSGWAIFPRSARSG